MKAVLFTLILSIYSVSYAGNIYEISCDNLEFRIDEINKNLTETNQIKIQLCDEQYDLYLMGSIKANFRTEVELFSNKGLCRDFIGYERDVVEISPSANLGIYPIEIIQILKDHGLKLRQVRQCGTNAFATLHSFSFPICN